MERQTLSHPNLGLLEVGAKYLGKMNMDDFFITRDLGLSATLLALGYKLIRPERRENIVYFTFSKKEECEEVSRKFELRSEPILVDAAEYFDAIQRLKRQIFKLTESLGVPKKYSYK